MLPLKFGIQRHRGHQCHSVQGLYDFISKIDLWEQILGDPQATEILKPVVCSLFFFFFNIVPKMPRMFFQWCFHWQFYRHTLAGNIECICFILKAKFCPTVGISGDIVKSDKFPRRHKSHFVFSTVTRNLAFLFKVFTYGTKPLLPSHLGIRFCTWYLLPMELCMSLTHSHMFLKSYLLWWREPWKQEEKMGGPDIFLTLGTHGIIFFWDRGQAAPSLGL